MNFMSQKTFLFIIIFILIPIVYYLLFNIDYIYKSYEQYQCSRQIDIKKAPKRYTVCLDIFRSLKINKSLTISDLNLKGLIFFCACGMYEDCQDKATSISNKLHYYMPNYNFNFGNDIDRQSLIFFFEREVYAIDISHNSYSLIREFESFCTTKTDTTLRDGDGDKEKI